METFTNKRQSLCMVCGKRLSAVNSRGNVQWQPSQVDDKGIICLTCYRSIGKDKAAKERRTKGSG